MCIPEVLMIPVLMVLIDEWGGEVNRGCACMGGKRPRHLVDSELGLRRGALEGALWRGRG